MPDTVVKMIYLETREIYGGEEQPYIHLDRTGIKLLYMSRLSALHFSRIIVVRIGGKMCAAKNTEKKCGWGRTSAINYRDPQHFHITLALGQ